MKTVLFVPGSGEDINSRDYASTIRAIEKKGYTVKFVPITWSRTTIDKWVPELEVEYANYDPKNTILAGFSFGAMTAFVAAAHKNPSELWLFSLSPYFAEDLISENHKEQWLREIGKRRTESFAGLWFEKYAKNIDCKTLVFYGQKELDKWPIMKERAESVREGIKNNTYYAIPGVGHDVADKIYIDAIKGAVS